MNNQPQSVPNFNVPSFATGYKHAKFDQVFYAAQHFPELRANLLRGNPYKTKKARAQYEAGVDLALTESTEERKQWKQDEEWARDEEKRQAKEVLVPYTVENPHTCSELGYEWARSKVEYSPIETVKDLENLYELANELNPGRTAEERSDYLYSVNRVLKDEQDKRFPPAPIETPTSDDLKEVQTFEDKVTTMGALYTIRFYNTEGNLLSLGEKTFREKFEAHAFYYFSSAKVTGQTCLDPTLYYRFDILDMNNEVVYSEHYQSRNV